MKHTITLGVSKNKIGQVVEICFSKKKVTLFAVIAKNM